MTDLAVHDRRNTQVAAQPERAAAFFELLRAPFPAGLGEASRLSALTSIGPHLPAALQVQVADTFDAHPPWTRPFLEFRVRAYRGLGDQREARAQRDLADFLADADPTLQELLPPAP
jgi:hypothetical protein